MSEVKACGAEALHNDKHTGIDNAIRNIDSAISHADNLIGRITGASNEETPKPLHVDPCLVDVLSGAEDEIRGKTDALHDRLTQIENILF